MIWRIFRPDLPLPHLGGISVVGVGPVADEPSEALYAEDSLFFWVNPLH